MRLLTRESTMKVSNLSQTGPVINSSKKVRQSKLPHSYLSQDGVFYYLRRINNKLVRFSLRTKEPETANMRIVIIDYIVKHRADMTPDEIEKMLALGRMSDLKITKGNTTYETNGSATDIVQLNDIEPAIFSNVSKERMAEYRRLAEEELEQAKQQAQKPAGEDKEQSLLLALVQQITAQNQATVSVPKSISTGVVVSLKQAIDLYIKDLENTGANVSKSIYEKKNIYLKFLVWLEDNHPGIAMDINTIHSHHSIAYINSILSAKKLAPNSQVKLHSTFRALFDWLILKSWYVHKNPFIASSSITSTFAKRNSRPWDPLSTTDLNKVFLKENYIQTLATRTPDKKHHDYYWGPLLALFSGMRIEEICSLQVKQIMEDEGIHYIKLITDDDMRTKNQNSNRVIPIADILIEMGFLNFVEQAKKFKRKRVFVNEENTGKNGYSRFLSAKWSKYLIDLKVKDTMNKKGFHSLRHTFIQHLTLVSNNAIHNMRIVGHTEDNKDITKSVHSLTYNKELAPMKVYKAIVEKVAKKIVDKQLILDLKLLRYTEIDKD